MRASHDLKRRPFESDRLQLFEPIEFATVETMDDFDVILDDMPPL
jgi:hypothetical protein